MTNPMAIVERVARAIQDVDVIAVTGAPMNDDVWRKLWADSEMRVMTEPYAVAAIAAMREPTEGMVNIGQNKCDDYLDAAECWAAMIDAALTESK